jgi:hypothetical protein
MDDDITTEVEQVSSTGFPCIVAAEPAKAWHGVILFANAKAMEMKVRPVEAVRKGHVDPGGRYAVRSANGGLVPGV